MAPKPPLIPWLILQLVFASFSAASIFDQASKKQCVPIQIPLCMDSRYKYTYFPNPIVQTDLQSADHFKPLLAMKCHPQLKFFVCSVFAPMCPEQMPSAVTSCRSLCEEVKKGCSGVLKDFSLEWPESLNCSKFPEYPELCMSPNSGENADGGMLSYENEGDTDLPLPRESGANSVACPTSYIDLDEGDKHGLCAFKCNSKAMFSNQEKQSTRILMIVGGTITFSVTAFTLLTFLIDRQRFLFPERSIFYISACYMFFSLPFVLRGFVSYEDMACDRLSNGRSPFLIVGTLENKTCVLSVLFSYYFLVAGNIWWLMLTFTWYLSAARKWVQEGIDACSSYLHLIAWALPALLTIAVFVTHKVDASELTGICSVGNANPWALLGFVIIPKLIFVLLGSCFIIAGFSSMCRERDSFRRRGTDTSKLEKLMVKMGIFSAFYVIPAVVMVVCDCYHMFILTKWHSASIACKIYSTSENSLCKTPENLPLPQSELYKLNVIMSLLVGVSTSMWTISSKTFHSWQKLLCCGLCSSAPAKSTLSGGCASSALNRPLIPTAQPPPPPHHYLPMTTSTAPSSHLAIAQPIWKQSKIV